MDTIVQKVAVVTGAARGQGASHANWLSRQGAAVALIDICHDIPGIYPLATPDDLSRTVGEIEAMGRVAIGIEADVRSSAEIADAIGQVVQRFGRIDILCNNAGVCRVHGIDEMTDEILDAVIDTNVKGIFNSMRHVAPVMKGQRSGRVINIASAGAIKTLGYASAYSASKGAVMVATKSWARELAEWGISVNCIAPGSILNEMTIGLMSQRGDDIATAAAGWRGQQVFEEMEVQASDISAMVVFLASDAARAITGQTYAVDAGWSIR